MTHTRPTPARQPTGNATSIILEAASDNVALVARQIEPWVPGRLWALGTDGFGRSDTRARLRRHFEVDAEHIAVATLSALAAEGRCDSKLVALAIKDLGLDPETPHSFFA